MIPNFSFQILDPMREFISCLPKLVVDPEDIETLQDLILSAVNEGIRQSQKMVQEELGKELGGLSGLKIPGFNM